MRHQILAVAGAVTIGLLGCACSSGGGTATASPPASQPASASPPASSASPAVKFPVTGPDGTIASVALRKVPGMTGPIVVEGTGRALYMFEADSTGKPACHGPCLQIWQPEIAGGKPAAAGGASQALVSTINLPSGEVQVTYNGHPLYYFTGTHGDTDDGVANGQGKMAFGAHWYVLDVTGNPVKPG